jgi:hypothetical protein
MLVQRMLSGQRLSRKKIISNIRHDQTEAKALMEELIIWPRSSRYRFENKERKGLILNLMKSDQNNKDLKITMKIYSDKEK